MKDKFGQLKRVDVYKMEGINERPYFKREFSYQGKFHGFGLDYEEFEDGAAGFTVAIVETLNGEVEMIRADLIQFVNPNA